MHRHACRSGIAARIAAAAITSAVALAVPAALALLTAFDLSSTRPIFAQYQPTAEPPEPTSTVEPPTPTPEPTQWPQTSACTLHTSKVAAPGTVQLGGTVQITLTARADCPQETMPLHLMLLLDGSSSMAGSPTRQMKDAAVAMVNRFELDNNPAILIGVVEINQPSRLLCPPTAGAAAVKACIRQVGASGGTDIARAIDLASDALAESRRAAGFPVGLQQVQIIVNDGSNSGGCSPVLEASRRAKSTAIIMTTVAIGSASDTQCLRSAASSPRYFYQADDAGGLIAVFERIRRGLLEINLRQLIVDDKLPANMAYVLGSAMPAAEIDAQSKQLTWRQSYVPRDGITMTFKVRPLEAGRHPTNAGAVAAFEDLGLGTGMAVFPVPSVVVIGDPTVPTATPIPAPPEGSASLGLANPRPRRGEQSRVSFSLRFDPPEPPARTHVVLVADASGSMVESNAQLKAGLRALVERMAEADPEAWKAAVVEFDSTARGLCGFSSDLEGLRSCIGRIGASGGTRIDLGLDMGIQVLRTGRPAPGHEDMVVFTDGASGAGCAPVLERANVAKAEGIELHTVCLGSACDQLCMRSAASSPAHYHEAPDPAGLAPVFDQVADRLVGDRRVASAVLRLQLPASLRLVAGSVSLPPAEAGEQTARWDLPALPAGDLRLQFSVEALAELPGTLSMTSETQFLDHPPQSLTTTADVLPPDSDPAPSATPPEPTPGTPATPPAPSATVPPDTPQPTATSKLDDPRGQRIYLPLAVREACPAEALDLALALDTSNSMAERAVDGGTKLDAAVAAAEALVAALRLPSDRVGVVSFNQSARRLSPLSGDRAAVLASLRHLALGNGTAIDQGLASARDVLAEPDRRPGSRRLILLLTDGRATTPAADAIALAAAAKAEGIEIYAVGLGSEVDARTLAGIASSAAHYRAAAGRADVVAAFDTIARRERCRGEHWGGR